MKKPIYSTLAAAKIESTECFFFFSFWKEERNSCRKEKVVVVGKEAPSD